MISCWVNYFSILKSEQPSAHRRTFMREPPRGWPRIASSVFYEDVCAAIDWLCRAPGFEARLVIEGEGGRIEYSELVLGGGQGGRT
jgi:hypothetical protein